MAAKPSLIMVTTTTIPYMYHVPSILATPTDIPYWFRYLTKYLHPDLVDALRKESVSHGVLYLRDEESAEKLCYPLRHFEILWSDVTGSLSFFNLRMGRYVRYIGADVAANEASPVAAQCADADSWGRVVKHRQELFAFNARAAQNQPPLPARPVPTRISAPGASEPKVAPWAAMRPAGFDGLLWLDQMPTVAQAFPNDDVLAWRELMSALAGVERINRTPCFFVRPPRTLSSGKVLVAKEFAKGAVRHPWGFMAEAKRNYVVRIDQLTPSALTRDAPSTKPFILTLESSDPALVPIVKQDSVDGAYGYYELSFSTKAERAGTYALLRVSAKDLKIVDPVGGEEAVSLPDVVIPLNLKSQLIPRILWTVTAALAIVGFVSADQWLPHIEIVKDDLAATLIKALLFGLATYAGKNAGIEGLLSGVGKKP